MKVNTSIQFSKKEIEAIKVLSDIDCKGINCGECPLNVGKGGWEPCIRTELRMLKNDLVDGGKWVKHTKNY